jgi:N6-L-threonylcarbamoyladenine synthase
MTEPGGRKSNFAYDANGNPIAVTPPGGVAHGFGFTASDLLGRYTPPDVGQTPRDSTYTYDTDKLLTNASTPRDALAFTHDKPVVPVHHLEGHLFATLLEHPEAKPPFTALLVSGGHTLLLDVPEWGRYTRLGQTRDDAVGEAFDKVAKLLGLPYPGGRPIEQLAATAEPPAHGHPHHFARPMLRRRAVVTDEDYYDCSFSGLKTAVLYAVRASEKAGTIEQDRASIARGFQDAVIDTLSEKVYRAAKAHRRGRIVLGGGVACNLALQQALRDRFAGRGGTVFAPSPRLATDNAAMIAAAGLFRFQRGEFAAPELTATASLPIPGML